MRSQQPIQHDRLVHKIPLICMLGVLAAKLGQKLAPLHLKVSRQGRRQQIDFAQANMGFAIGIKAQVNVSKTAKIRVDSTVEGKFGTLDGETASLGVVVA